LSPEKLAWNAVDALFEKGLWEDAKTAAALAMALRRIPVSHK
jgi:hypothetical protein